MHRLLSVFALLALAVPAVAQEAQLPLPEGCDKAPWKNDDGKTYCHVYRPGGWMETCEVDPVGWRVAPDNRRWKLSIGGIGSDRIRTNTPAIAPENIGEGSFLPMLGSAVGSWLDAKDGRHVAAIGVGTGGTASLSLLTNNPQAFSEGEAFTLWGSRSPGEFSRDGAGFPTVEFRPRLGGWKSRWRLGTQLAFSHEQYGSVDAAVERIGVTDVSVSPYSPQFVRVDGLLNRSWHREEYRLRLSAWQFTVGPEFELVHGGPVDLSVEAGYAYFHYRGKGTSDLYQAPYLVFAPEVFVPDVDPARFLEGGDTPLTDGTTTDSSRHRFYAGLRADIFPFQNHLGINAGVRWYSGDLPLTRTFAPELFGPFDVQARAKHWVATVGLTLAWTHAE